MIVASPTPIATTLPSTTVAIVESEVDHAIAGLVVLAGNTVATRVNSSPRRTSFSVASRAIESAKTIAFSTTTGIVAVNVFSP